MDDESRARLVNLIREQRVAALGTLREGFPEVSMVPLVAVLDLIVAGSAVVSLGPFALANVIGIGALAALYGYHRISPPLVALTLVGLLFLAALLLPAGTATPPDAR